MKAISTSQSKLLRLISFCAPVLFFLYLIQWYDRSQNDLKKTYTQIYNSKVYFENIKNVSFKQSFTRQNNTSAVDRYFVRTEHCMMPYVNPFSSEIKRIYKPLQLQNCSTVERLVESVFDANLKQYYLNIRSDVARTLTNYSGDIRCCYKEILRKTNSDNGIILKPCIDFKQNFLVPPHIEGILTVCYSANRSKLLQEDGFTFIQMENQTSDLGISNTSRKPSVLLFGIDSVSRINFRRTMLKTYQYVKFNGWYEMQGYNKMGDNTFPNAMAMMAGYSGKTAQEKCQVKKAGGLDACPLLWKSFRQHGYRTAYAEDESDMSTFNYLKAGFQKPPTDHYLRPFMQAFERHLVVKKRCGLHNCLGMRHTAQYIYDFAIQLAVRYNDEPIFGLFWANSFSHNCYDTPSAMDHIIHSYMQDLERLGILDSSIVILFSDHGMRYGTIRNLADGFLEERLPMLFIWLPMWYRQQYPEIVEALEVNRNRLTSPYDLHMTLKHILQMTADAESIRIEPPFDCPRCQSLFYAVPLNRTCEDAGISEHWCTCVQYEDIAKNATHEKIATLVVDAMNSYLSTKPLNASCSELHLHNVEKVSRRMRLTAHELHAVNTYKIKYKTIPNMAIFQATVDYFKQNNTIRLDVESISRLTSYETDSKCVNDKQAKKYCICRDAVLAEKKN